MWFMKTWQEIRLGTFTWNENSFCKFSLLKWLFWSNCKINWWHELNLCINQIILKWYPTPFLSIFSLNSNSIVQSGCEIFVIITNYSSKENVASKAFSSRKVVVGVEMLNIHNLKYTTFYFLIKIYLGEKHNEYIEYFFFTTKVTFKFFLKLFYSVLQIKPLLS